MAVFEKQLRLDDVSPEYAEFVEKFKPKKTTDDCYTPENVFEAVAAWACAEYGIERAAIVRPFYPGGDYERYDYPEGCVVLDNPPFSILTQILNFYNAHGVRFFLFAPSIFFRGWFWWRKAAAGIRSLRARGVRIISGTATNGFLAPAGSNAQP